jgi:hypothetical protein
VPQRFVFVRRVLFHAIQPLYDRATALQVMLNEKRASHNILDGLMQSYNAAENVMRPKFQQSYTLVAEGQQVDDRIKQHQADIVTKKAELERIKAQLGTLWLFYK